VQIGLFDDTVYLFHVADVLFVGQIGFLVCTWHLLTGTGVLFCVTDGFFIGQIDLLDGIIHLY